ncbi:MAG: ComF family protein [Bacteroidaceae bacterium]|nr:ComF family protein [Bacteroidaceae bacterium]
MRLIASLRLGLHSFIDLILPRRCVACGSVLAYHEYHICPWCAKRIAYNPISNWELNNRISQWYHIRELQRVAAYTIYERDSVVARIIHQLKYGHKYELGEWMGRMAASELDSTHLFDGVDALVPIPLSRQRQRKRGYNQSELIAIGISKLTGIPVWSNILERTVNNTSQTRVEFWQRYTNAKNIFRLKPSVDRSLLEGKHLMVVDDVMTTGTTLFSAIMVLRHIADVNISTFSWAWTRTGSSQHSVASSIYAEEDEEQQGEAPEGTAAIAEEG